MPFVKEVRIFPILVRDNLLKCSVSKDCTRKLSNIADTSAQTTATVTVAQHQQQECEVTGDDDKL